MNSQPVNNGFQNKFSQTYLCDPGSNQGNVGDEDQYENAEDDADSSESSDSFENGGYANEESASININLGDQLGNFATDLPDQINEILAGINISSNGPSEQFNVYHNGEEDSSDSSSDSFDDDHDHEEFKHAEGEYYEDEGDEEEPEDEEAHITPDMRANIINSIPSFNYSGKAGEKCVV